MALDDLTVPAPQFLQGPSVTGVGPAGATLDIPSVLRPPQPAMRPPAPALARPVTPPAPGPSLQVPPPSLHDFTLRPELKRAMTKRESGGDPRARGKAGEYGPMQVLPATAQMYGVTPEQLKADSGIADWVGEQYMNDLLRRYHGNEFLALVAYNSGPGRVDRGQLLPQSVKYATQILNKSPHPLTQAAADRSGGKVPLMQAQPPPTPQSQSAPPMPAPTGGVPLMQAQPPPTVAAPSASQGAGGVPLMMSQTAPPNLPPAAQAQPGILQRVGRALESGFEGTAYAQEGPPPPLPGGGGRPIPQFAGAPQATPSASQPGQPLPPMGPIYPSGRAGPAPTQPGDPSQKTTFGLTLPGGIHVSSGDVTPPAQERVQAAAMNQTLPMLDYLLHYYDVKVKPHEQEYGQQEGQGVLTDPWAALKGAAAGPMWSHSERSQFLFGTSGNRDIKRFFDLQGPLIAAQLRTLVGGRIGQAMMDGPLAQHIPTPSGPRAQSLPDMRQRLEDMRFYMRMNLANVYNMQSRGMSEDDIIRSLGGDPKDYPASLDAPQAAPEMPSLDQPAAASDPDAAAKAQADAAYRAGQR